MEITISKSSLNKVLEKIDSVLPLKPAIMITGGILIETKEENISFISTDLENTIKINIQAKVEKQGNIVIPGKKFISLIKQLGESDIKIEQKENNVDIKVKNSSYSFICMQQEEFPKFPKFSGDINFTINGKELKTALDRVKFCINSEEARSHFRGGLLDVKEDGFNIVGTDTKRLALVELKSDKKNQQSFKYLLPYKLINTLLTLLHDEDVNISIGKNQVSFQFNDTFVVSQLLSGSEDFPDYNNVIPEQKTLRFASVNRDELLSILKRISIFTNERYNKVKLSFSKNLVVFSINSPEVGEAQEKMAIEYVDEEQKLAFSPQFLIDFLQKIKDEKVHVGFTNEKKPVLLKGEKTPGYLYIAMPLKIE